MIKREHNKHQWNQIIYQFDETATRAESLLTSRIYDINEWTSVTDSLIKHVNDVCELLSAMYPTAEKVKEYFGSQTQKQLELVVLRNVIRIGDFFRSCRLLGMFHSLAAPLSSIYNKVLKSVVLIKGPLYSTFFMHAAHYEIVHPNFGLSDRNPLNEFLTNHDEIHNLRQFASFDNKDLKVINSVIKATKDQLRQMGMTEEGIKDTFDTVKQFFAGETIASTHAHTTNTHQNKQPPIKHHNQHPLNTYASYKKLKPTNNHGESKIIAFYKGYGTNQSGHTLAQIMNFDLTQLENEHYYIQWLFPLDVASDVVKGSPILTPSDINYFRRNNDLKQKMYHAFLKMVDFYRLLYNYDTGDIFKNFGKEHPHWITKGNHNYRRITRMITSMRLLGLDELSQSFKRKMLEICKDKNYRNIIGPVTKGIWEQA